MMEKIKSYLKPSIKVELNQLPCFLTENVKNIIKTPSEISFCNIQSLAL